MTATLNVGFWASYVEDGRLESMGDPSAPIAEVATTGGGMLRRKVSIAAGATVSLWDYTEQEDFELLALRIPGTGYLNLAIKADKPTSDSDATPLGTHKSWRQIDMTCKIPFLLNTDAALVNSTQSDDNGESAGLPIILSDAGTETGKVYEVVAKNPGSSAVEVDVWVFN